MDFLSIMSHPRDKSVSRSCYVEPRGQPTRHTLKGHHKPTILMRDLHLLDSITQITRNMGDSVIVSGSHGGVSSASYVVNAPNKPWAVFFNDAGVGKDRAGIEALNIMDALGVMAFAYGHESARIGESTDGLKNGVITHANRAASKAFPLSQGCQVADMVEKLRLAKRDLS